MPTDTYDPIKLIKKNEAEASKLRVLYYTVAMQGVLCSFASRCREYYNYINTNTEYSTEIYRMAVLALYLQDC